MRGAHSFAHFAFALANTQKARKVAGVSSGAMSDILAAGESFTVEFKVDVNDDELVEAVVCLANGDGGNLYLGVDNDGTVVGARPRHGELTDGARLAALVANRTAPPVAATADVRDLAGGQVVVVTVPKATSMVATTGGLYLRRAIDVQGNPQCLPVLPHEVTTRVTGVGGRDVSTLPLPALGVDDLDAAELRRFRDLARAGGDHVLGDMSDLDLLGALGFRTPDGGLTLGAVLTFGSPLSIARTCPTHETAFQVLEADGGVRVNRIEHAPLLRSMEDLVAAIEPYNPEEEIQQGLFRVGLPAFSHVAIREVLANALVHRDYTVNGQVRVLIEQNTLSVSNPGGFPEGINLQNLLTAPPQARNPRIADAFKRAGVVERTGRGVNRVYREQLSTGRPRPDYSRSTRQWVEVRLRGGPTDRELAAYVAQAERDARGLDLDTLQVLYEVRGERRITSARAAELLQVPIDEARAVLNRLVEQGLLEARGERKGRTYHLSAAVYRQLGEPARYVRTRGFDRIQQENMVASYVAEHGSISRSEAAELCQLDPGQASTLLRRLARDGRLVMRGSRRTARYFEPHER